jgi:alpha-tubulin suppressor-like RCC1 family protein
MDGVLLNKKIISISLGAEHSCVISNDNKAFCWGWNK